ncbi:hypothetical protein QBC38DRAFT_451463 [Podospora fimiseda]|uniref:Carbohydrate-binding module family 19 domain-containing protein n=1 Tax=Podospora fimiseda TaxID=252190 RepID=A0AAN7BWT8_9PEZI|nr:hypothetical protein QBC38DRAFT_451463 [Podospora fimiseda]
MNVLLLVLFFLGIHAHIINRQDSQDPKLQPLPEINQRDTPTSTSTSTVIISFTGSIPPPPPPTTSDQHKITESQPTRTSTTTQTPKPVYPPPSWSAFHCNMEGAFLCLDAVTFGHCANGWMIPQLVAPGTICVGNGQFVWAT